MKNETLHREYQELLEMVRMIETQEFQKFIVKPLKDYRYKQTNNFFSDSLKDQWRKGGRVEAVNEFIKILAKVKKDCENKLFELKSDEE